MNNHSEAIEALNDLIQVNFDRIEGYERAIVEMKESNNDITASLFEQYVKSSQNNVETLSEYVVEFGGTPADSPSLGGKVHRFWMEVRNTFAIHEKESILESCIFGDAAAIKFYEAALADTTNNFPIGVTTALNVQLLAIKATHAANVAYEKTLEAMHV